ncbi:hypothetical protein CEXT_135931 [Caerostris extrusa]|uniref:Uncharacterized protein n=1 Tax=Caerostris extrusa TaxID=172846 RepID=A0AAV4PR84_CAEEX|nr:hypothetical protein CEXT_135931 [Caerostris extrusa]
MVYLFFVIKLDSISKKEPAYPRSRRDPAAAARAGVEEEVERWAITSDTRGASERLQNASVTPVESRTLDQSRGGMVSLSFGLSDMLQSLI